MPRLVIGQVRVALVPTPGPRRLVGTPALEGIGRRRLALGVAVTEQLGAGALGGQLGEHDQVATVRGTVRQPLPQSILFPGGPGPIERDTFPSMMILPGSQTLEEVGNPGRIERQSLGDRRGRPPVQEVQPADDGSCPAPHRP